MASSSVHIQAMRAGVVAVESDEGQWLQETMNSLCSEFGTEVCLNSRTGRLEVRRKQGSPRARE